MRRQPPALAAAAAVSALAAVSVFEATRLEGRIETAAADALRRVGADWATTRVDGQRVELLGVAPSPIARREAVVAVKRAIGPGGAVWGAVSRVGVSGVRLAPAPASLEPPPAAPSSHVPSSRAPDVVSGAGPSSAPAPSREPQGVQRTAATAIERPTEQPAERPIEEPAENKAVDEEAASALSVAPPAPTRKPSPETALADACARRLSAALADFHITFASGDADIGRGVARLLTDVADEIAACGPVNVTVVGHTDRSGDAGDNLKLSYERAAAVSAFLAQVGVGEARLAARGDGAAVPVATNETAAGRALNRRIEFEVAALSGGPARVAGRRAESR